MSTSDSKPNEHQEGPDVAAQVARITDDLLSEPVQLDVEAERLLRENRWILYDFDPAAASPEVTAPDGEVRERLAFEVWAGMSFPQDRDAPDVRRIWRDISDRYPERRETRVVAAYETADRILALPEMRAPSGGVGRWACLRCSEEAGVGGSGPHISHPMGEACPRLRQ